MDNRRWIYLLLASTAAGYGLGEAELGEAKAAVPHTLSRIAVKDLPQGGSDTVDIVLVNQLCADAKVKLGLTENECTAELFKIKGFSGAWIVEEGSAFWRLSASVRRVGNFTPSEPQ